MGSRSSPRAWAWPARRRQSAWRSACRRWRRTSFSCDPYASRWRSARCSSSPASPSTRAARSSSRAVPTTAFTHGIEGSGPSASSEPLAYYHRSGPAGSLFRALGARGAEALRVAVIGLGVGTLAAYARRGEHWTFYELDPTVLYVARDSGLFTYWQSSAGRLDATLGDARIRLAEQTDVRYDLLVLDAFSADAIPVHLLTREALALYRRRLRSNGVLAIHISNRYLDLEGVVQALAADAGMRALAWADLSLTNAQRAEGKLASHWVVLSTDTGLIDRLAASDPWRILSDDATTAVWSDQFSNLLRVIRWRGSPGE